MTPSKDRPDFWDGVIPWISPKDMKVALLNDSLDHISDSAVASTGLKLHAVDSVLVVTRGMILAHTFPVARNAVPVTVNQDMKVLRARGDLNSGYLAWMLVGLESLMLSLTDESAHGTKVLRMDQWANFPVPVPEPETQAAIVKFLNDKTARIDALIDEKERLHTLLLQQRSEAVDRAVLGIELESRGAALKGLEVLGPIPLGWASTRMKYELEYVTSGSRGWADYYSDSGSLFVRIGNLTRDSIELDLEDVQRVDLTNTADGVRARVQPGDLLISITAYLGSVAVAPDDIEEAYVSQHVSLARPNRVRALPNWLGYVVLSSIGRTFFELQAYGGTKVQLSLDDIRELPIPLPDIAVQRKRILSLEARLNALDGLIIHVSHHIARLREYRRSLISAAVTGWCDLTDMEDVA
jgi:type I restriction enzyme S subunit